MKRDNWPVEDEGIRPAGPPDRCFYCDQPRDEPHAAECVVRLRTVVVEVTLRVVRKVPESWTPDEIEFHLNESSWCANNILDDIEAMTKDREDGESRCLCPHFQARYVSEATQEDERATGVRVED